MTKHSENWSGNTLLWSVFIVHIWVWPLPPTGGCRSMLHLEIICFASLRWKNVLRSKIYTFSRITSFVNTGAAEICIAKDVTHSSHLTAGTQNFAEISELSDKLKTRGVCKYLKHLVVIHLFILDSERRKTRSSNLLNWARTC